MGKREQQKAAELTGKERRSSVRVRSRLPCAVDPIDAEEIAAIEARILDTAVLESDGVMHEAVDWRDHVEDLSREMVFVLNEIRALRQQVTEAQRVIEHLNETKLERRWVELNSQGLWLGEDETDDGWNEGDYAQIRIQIPSIQTPEILAVGEVIRLDDAQGREGIAFEFASICDPHRRAISSYALRRERQKARSKRLGFDFDL